MFRYQHPEPGTAYTYEVWRDGLHNGKAIVDMVTERPVVPDKVPPSTPHQPYDVCLQDTFREKGFQVIIGVEGIELTPNNLKCLGNEWEPKGMKNEHIVAVGIFAYVVENVTKSRIAFCQETDVSPGFFRHGPSLYQASTDYSPCKSPVHEQGKRNRMEAISDIFGVNTYQMCSDHHVFALPFQENGRMALPQGRLIAFPNVMESHREPFRLDDPKKNGHHRWVTIMLVDPNYRLCSTRNVPPQQPIWQGDSGNARDWLGEIDPESPSKDAAGEHKRIHCARYAMVGTLFFC